MTEPLYATPNVIVRPSLLKPETIGVSDENDLVAITIGNSTLRMHYEDALRLSQMIRVHAKRAKRKNGDVSRHWSAVGDLEGIAAR